MEIKREISRDKTHINQINGAKPQFGSFHKVRRNTAQIAEDDYHHKVWRLSIHPFRPVCPPNRERPRKTER
jgi:hypothetical protein